MQKAPIMLGKLLILFALLFIPSWAMANNLTIIDVETHQATPPRRHDNKGNTRDHEAPIATGKSGGCISEKDWPTYE